MKNNRFGEKKLPPGPWQTLLRHAFTLIDDLVKHSGVSDPMWTFGGGTVLMLRHNHRVSKDIDIFVPDPQYLGYVSPRLSDVAESVTTDYVEGPSYIKLMRSEGEIDFVASRNLTTNPFEKWNLLGRSIRVETSSEIVAKKLYHRGDRATARDLFDLALVIEKEPEELETAAPFLVRHRSSFIQQIHERRFVLEAQFESIDRLNFNVGYQEATERATRFLELLPTVG